jgi:NAD(P)H-dependent FMN reductase
MVKIIIISSSIRDQRNSHKVSLYFRNYIVENKLADVEILDLKEFNFPLFTERLRYLKDPPPAVLEFAASIEKSDGVIIITPEYNGGYPASLKNVIDLLHKEWIRKPVGIATVSDGNFGGSQVITSLQFVLWKMKAHVITERFIVPNVVNNFDENGRPFDKESTDRRASVFIKELIWIAEENKK